ncbi:Calcium channel, voltage-dependent, alpha 2/delta, invertebrate [Operophtera brumata]|uniref:Calcium channel, voltage-dependent, alpha 2/delta, invertebrate n=1 Tax=Operophtera brumata TaxID=104452 RepID=A0A0L7LUM5_OPEBR|nr:Calcium channel, voltage-dependent, alpha 2/delta, invertebrate [Operophtera brumata]
MQVPTQEPFPPHPGSTERAPPPNNNNFAASIRQIPDVFVPFLNLTGSAAAARPLAKYHEYSVEVVRKDGLLLVRELAAEVKNHMDFKINAVMNRVK